MACRSSRSVGLADLDARAHLATPLPAPRDHAHLEGQQLVVREPAHGGVALLEVVGVVRRLDGLPDGGLSGHDVRLQVLAVRPEAIEAAADGLPKRPRREAAGEPVDRHDASHVQHRAAVVALELGVVELGAPALQLHLAAGHHARHPP